MLMRLCAYPGCRTCIPMGERYCEKHRAKAGQYKERNRASSHRRGYNGAWRRARSAFLMVHPLCEECKRNGRQTPAVVVDHIIPHKGNGELFWNEKNWQALCKSCHDRKTAKEDGGFGNIGRGGSKVKRSPVRDRALS